jgi:hypothetical protein
MADRLDGHEPADPSSGDAYEDRRETRLGPDTLQPDKSATPLWECGCGECSHWVDPLAVATVTQYAADECPSPKLMTIARAKEAYVRYQSASHQTAERTGAYERHLGKYATILEADRRLQRAYSGLSTAMLTRRQSPLDEHGEWIPPVSLHSRLADTFASIRKSLSYHLGRKGGFTYEYLAVTAMTDSAATPHQHIVLWVEDPADDLHREMLQPAVNKHVASVATATHEDHGDGAVTIQHSPDRVDHVPEAYSAIHELTNTIEQGEFGPSVPKNTTVAQYVGSQLPHLYLGHVLGETHGEQENLSTHLDGGAVAWASPYRTVCSSSGVALS